MYFKPLYTGGELQGHYFILAAKLEDCQSLSFASEFTVKGLWGQNGSEHQEAGSWHPNNKNIVMELGDYTLHRLKLWFWAPVFLPS